MPSRAELCPYDLLPPCCCFLALLSKYSSTHVTIIMIRPKALITFIAASYGLRIIGALPVVPMHLPHRLSVVTPKGDTGISDDFRVIVTRYAIAPALVRFKFANSVLE